MRVLPIANNGKSPLIGKSFHAATTDHSEISRWWKRWPDANLAVAVPHGVLVIDIDLDKPVAAQTITSLESEYGPLPATRTVRTPKGGLHYYYAVPDDVRFRGIAGPGVDLRAGGRHYVLVPPSRIGTVRYEYLDGDEWTPLAELPLSWVAGLEHQRPTLRTTKWGILPAALRGIGHVQLETVTLADLGGYLDALPSGRMDTLMSRAVEPTKLAESMRRAAHDTLTRVSYRVIALAAGGHPGGRDAVQRVIVAFAAEIERRLHAGEPARDPDEITSEVVRAVAGAGRIQPVAATAGSVGPERSSSSSL
ncbi:bifunctional DNA primase/polymerase [Gordonia sp. NPDC058843]|uniref:bifunctional DNA primase/polymerase n=1 Tax=Gordonia sp. NPDC058843 TaxID=3346648 RepID=UPI0036C647D5